MFTLAKPKLTTGKLDQCQPNGLLEKLRHFVKSFQYLQGRSLSILEPKVATDAQLA